MKPIMKWKLLALALFLIIFISSLTYFWKVFKTTPQETITTVTPKINELKEKIEPQNIYLPDQDLYALTLEKDNKTDTISLKNIKPSKGYLQRQPVFSEDSYILKVLNKEKGLIYTSSFNIPKAVIYDNLEGEEIWGNINFPEKTEFQVIIPYDVDIETIQIYSKENLEEPIFDKTFHSFQGAKVKEKNLFTLKLPFIQAATTPRCLTLLNNRPADQNYDITFIGERNYNTAGETEFIKDILIETSKFLKLSPIKNYFVGFNIHYVNTFDAICESINNFPYFSCTNYSHLVSVCPTDLVVVMKNSSNKGFAWFNGGPIYTGDYSYTFAHEAGHAFGNLWDEYVYSCGADRHPCNSQELSGWSIASAPNCDVASCSKWSNINGTGCYGGCTASDWYRSIETSLMRSLSSQFFGPINENHLLNRVLIPRFGTNLPQINIPPRVLFIKGPGTGEVNKTLEFYFSAFDYNDNQLKLTIDWGNGTITRNVKILGEGQELLQKKKYTKPGTFFIKAKVSDPQNQESEWSSPFQITIVKKIEKPTLTFQANPTIIKKGQSSTLSWSSGNTTSCEASNGWSGAKPTSGSEMVSPSKTSTYTLECSGPGGQVKKSVTVSVKKK